MSCQVSSSPSPNTGRGRRALRGSDRLGRRGLRAQPRAEGVRAEGCPDGPGCALGRGGSQGSWLCVRAGQTPPEAPARVLSLLTLTEDQERFSALCLWSQSPCPQIKWHHLNLKPNFFFFVRRAVLGPWRSAAGYSPLLPQLLRYLFFQILPKTQLASIIEIPKHLFSSKFNISP